MGQKIRINTLYEMKNGLSSNNPGDKIYKNPECEPGFYKGGELIPGSSNKLPFTHVSKRHSNFYETIDLNIKSLDPNKLWKNKVKNDELNFQTTLVKDLDIWEENLKLLVQVEPPIQVPNPSGDKKKVITQNPKKKWIIFNINKIFKLLKFKKCNCLFKIFE